MNNNTTNQDTVKIKDKAQKLHALAERGIDGEKDNAKRKLREYVDMHREVIGYLYPDYLSRRFKGKYKAPADEPVNSGQSLYDRLQNMVMHQCVDCTIEELPILVAIAKNMNIWDCVQIYNSKTGLFSVMINCKRSEMKLLRYRFIIYQKDFANYMESLMLSYFNINEISTGNYCTGNQTAFYKACNKAIKKIKF